jgi:hypothetical protein
MFRDTQDPSSGSYNQYLTKITGNCSIVQACYVRCQCYVGIFRKCQHNTGNARYKLARLDHYL